MTTMRPPTAFTRVVPTSYDDCLAALRTRLRGDPELTEDGVARWLVDLPTGPAHRRRYFRAGHRLLDDLAALVAVPRPQRIRPAQAAGQPSGSW